MSQIKIDNLSFKYDSLGEEIFKDVSLVFDTDWKLGLIGRNGRGKTTLLKLLSGDLKGKGSIISDVSFGYFPIYVEDKRKVTIDVIKDAIAPFSVWEKEMEELLEDESKINEYGKVLDEYILNDGYFIEDKIRREVSFLDIDYGCLERDFSTLSGGEQTKLLLVAMFLRKNQFLLIDEPTNHLDLKGREVVSKYLASKKGFILVSHDRSFIDRVCDHIASINKFGIEVIKGNYSSWKLNKDNRDKFLLDENDKLRKDINRLKKAALEKAKWGDRIEGSKIGNGSCDRGFIGHRSAKMMKRAKSIAKRRDEAIESKSRLVNDLEYNSSLKLSNVSQGSGRVLELESLSISYGKKTLFKPLSFFIDSGECIWLRGLNGSGKSSILKLIIGENISYSGSFYSSSKISYISQDTSFLSGYIDDFLDYYRGCNGRVNGDKLRNNLFKLGVDNRLFCERIETWSDGQKKKLLIAKSLCEEAELYIWDEPLNYIDIVSRKQIEDLILSIKPTMLIVEHDVSFLDGIVTKVVDIEKVGK